MKYGVPDQTGIATILPCLFAHSLVFDTNEVWTFLTFIWYVYLSFCKLSIIMKHTVASVGLISRPIQ